MKRSYMVVLFVTVLFCVQGAAAQSVSDLFERVRSSVVVITTEETAYDVSANQIQEVSQKGLGSGVLIEGGLVLTAAHVVQTANLVLVKFYDGQEIFGTVIGLSPQADVAILRLDSVPRNIPELPLGDSDGVRTGDDIIVVGAPFGLEYTLTKGIISGRSSLDQKTTSLNQVDFFQTDASINSGNSGGPMFNLDGEVIGIVSSILTQSGGFEGIGFAATSNIARSVLIDKKAFWWGVDGILLEGGMARLFNVPQEEGYLVQKVAADSPASRLGLIPSVIPMSLLGQDFQIGGDIVLSIQEIEVKGENMGSLRELTSAFRKGDQIRVTALRGGQVVQLMISY